MNQNAFLLNDKYNLKNIFKFTNNMMLEYHEKMASNENKLQTLYFSFFPEDRKNHFVAQMKMSFHFGQQTKT